MGRASSLSFKQQEAWLTSAVLLLMHAVGLALAILAIVTAANTTSLYCYYYQYSTRA